MGLNEPISADQAYEERYGDGTSPSGARTLEQLQADWQLPETPNSTSPFDGKGRPNMSAPFADNVSSFDARGNCDLDDCGYNTDWNFQWRQQGTTTWTNGTTNTLSAGSGTTRVQQTMSPLSSNTTYEFRLRAKNIHNAGNYVYSDIRAFTTT